MSKEQPRRTIVVYCSDAMGWPTILPELAQKAKDADVGINTIICHACHAFVGSKDRPRPKKKNRGIDTLIRNVKK